MIRFDSDYLEGAHPAILQRLMETNLEQTAGYGADPYCQAAAEKIRAACETPDAAVHFLVGGTQTNTIVICSLLRPYEGVLCPDSGHINCHEVNAIESTGHKVLAVPARHGKIRAEDIARAVLAWQNDAAWEHIVKPGMVYISQPTETGSIYTKAELTAIRKVCSQYGLPLFIDGARLAAALAAPGNDLSLPELAKLCDIFYIGGTKSGALFGEAVVIPNPGLIDGFRSIQKQRGGLLAKGRLLGLQFDTLFTDRLYFRLGEHAVKLAMELKEGFLKKGYPFWHDSPTNQQFPILTAEQAARLRRDFSFEDFGSARQGRRIARFCTSWAATEEQVRCLLEKI